MHSLVFVIVPDTEASSMKEAWSKAKEKLAPFNEHLELRARWVKIDDWTLSFVLGENYDKSLNHSKALGRFFKDEGESSRVRKKNGGYEHHSKVNVDGKWDYYHLGGRWEESLPVNQNVQSVYARPKSSTGANVLRVRDIDFGSRKEEAETEAAKDFKKSLPVIAPFLCGRLPSQNEPRYYNHPMVSALINADLSADYQQIVALLDTDEEAYVYHEVIKRTIPAALLLDGNWLEADSHETKRSAYDLIMGLSGSDWLVLVDAHS